MKLRWSFVDIWSRTLCWLLWHDHRTPDGNFHSYCQRCGDHINEHSV